MPQILFTEVSSAKHKLNWLSDRVQSLFQQGICSLILVDSMETAQFVDQFLWQFPKEAFVPHEMGDLQRQAAIYITWVPRNLNQAKALINLTANPTDVQDVETIFELKDLTKPESIWNEKVKYYQDLNGSRIDHL